MRQGDSRRPIPVWVPSIRGAKRTLSIAIA
jgi:hypothetical protein